tara:strand:+ start:559 stop:1485 length:927 start_codon:yes stop_codon:yes gene_type:complete
MKPAIKILTKSLGDTICSIPTINKLYQMYGEPITVFTVHPTLFKNHPSVLEIKDIDDNSEDYILHKTCIFDGHKKHNAIDIRQFHAWDLGISLTGEDMGCDLYCEKEKEIGYDNYVIIHPSITWESRTWSKNNWQELTNRLISIGLKVVIVGSDIEQKDFKYFTNSDGSSGYKEVSKNIYDIQGGVDLINKTTIPELRWMMGNKALCVVTMDSGILHVAGTTDCYIIQLGSSFNNKLRAPWRNGRQDYKYNYIKGGCDIACGSDLKYGLKEHGNIHGIPLLRNCQEKYPNFECHPKVDNVLKSIINLT